MKKSNEHLVKTFNNARHFDSNLVKNKYDALAFNYVTSLPERYRRKEIRIHAHLSGGFTNFCSIFEYYGMGRPEPKFSLIPHENRRANSSFDANNLNKSMLVSVVNLFEPNQGVFIPTPTTAMIWLQPLDQCLMFRTQQFQHTFAQSSVTPTIGENRELQRAIPCNCFGFGVKESKLINQVIKRRPQIVSDFSDIDTPLKVRWQAIHLRAPNLISSLRIYFRPDDMILGFLTKDILTPTESFNFTFCTDYLESCAIQGMHMLYYPHEEGERKELEKKAKDSTGIRDSRTHKGRVSRESKEDNQALNSRQPSEVESQTSPVHHFGDCISKHIRSGRIEDA